MRKLWLIVPALLPAALLLVLAFSADTASADAGPHVKGWGATPSECAACHRAHRGLAPLLLLEEETALCESCHGDGAIGSTLNVFAGTNEADGGALRGGGFNTARIDTDDPSLRPAPVTIAALPQAGAEPTASKHNVGSLQTAWGYGGINATADAGKVDFELECGKCHDPHGSGNYRALRTIPSELLSYGQAAPSWFTKIWDDADADGKIDTGEDVWLDDENPKQYSTTNYWSPISYTDWWKDSDGDGNADTEQTGRQVGKWCTTCHTRYLAPAGAYGADSGDAIFKYRHATDPSTRHTSATGPASPQSCFQCHVSHGSNAVVAGSSATEENPDGSAGAGVNDSRLLKMNGRGVCQKCHNK